jgi:hypothetical protein
MRMTLALGVFLAGALAAQAQTPAPVPTAAPTLPPATTPAVTTPAVAKTAATPAKAPAKARDCTRLPLSDIQVGRAETIASARQKLVDEYAPKVAKQRGWKKGFTVSLETATCEDYLYVPLLGQEYKCLVTATFCQK